MLRDHNICSGLVSYHGNIMFLEANDNLINYYRSSFFIRSSIFMGRIQYLVDRETISTCCHVGCHVGFLSILVSLVPQALKTYC